MVSITLPWQLFLLVILILAAIIFRSLLTLASRVAWIIRSIFFGDQTPAAPN